MSETGGIEAGGKPHYSKQEIDEYRDRYQKGFDIFQKAFKDYNEPNIEPHKKAQLQKVMSEALQVMNQTACVALKKEKLEDEKRLNESYASFIESPAAESQQKVSDDINSLKN